jgi:hypothetical protein
VIEKATLRETQDKSLFVDLAKGSEGSRSAGVAEGHCIVNVY